MRWFLRVYSIIYMALIIGAFVTLRRVGVLVRLPRAWVILSLVGAVACGILLAILSWSGGPPDRPPSDG